MISTSDCFTASDRPISEESPETSIETPIEQIDQTYQYRQESEENTDQSPVSEKMPPSWQPRKHRSKKRKPSSRKTSGSRFPEPKPNSSNEYSPIVCLGFTMIKFLFLFVVGFIIAYVFASVTYPQGVKMLGEVGSIVILPLVILVFCMMAVIVFIESCR